MIVGDDCMEHEKITFQSDNNTLIWKSPVVTLGEEDEILCPPTHEIIFIKEGMLEEIFNQGTYRPIRQKGLFKKDKRVSVEIIYVNKSIEFNVNWGTPTRLDIVDPFSKMLVKYGACGKYTISVENTRRLYEKILSSNKFLTIDAIKEYFKESIVYIAKTEISNMILEHNVGFNEIYSYLEEVSERIVGKIQPEFQRAGLKISGFTFTNIIIDDDDLNEIKAKTKMDATQTKADMYCPKCGYHMDKSVKFCPECGANLSLLKRCSDCNNVVSNEDVFCMNCGKKL